MPSITVAAECHNCYSLAEDVVLVAKELQFLQRHTVDFGQLVAVVIQADDVVALLKVNLCCHIAPLSVGIGKYHLSYSTIYINEEVLAVLAGMPPADLALHAWLGVAAYGDFVVAAFVAIDIAPLKVVYSTLAEKYCLCTT